MHNNFSVSISVDGSSGRILAVYFQIRTGKVAKTKELAEGRLMADYNRNGQLIGIDMIAPCSASVLDKIEIEAPAKAFVKSVIPPQFSKGRLPRFAETAS